MKKLFFVLVMLGIFTGVSLAETAPVVTTNAAADNVAPEKTVKKAKTHKKAKPHKKAKKEVKEDKKKDTAGTVNAAK